MASNKTKARNFGFILYPDSIPNDWKEKLESLGISMAVSPLHDMDEKKDENTWNSNDVIRNGKHYKKPHYHVIYIARNPVTIESVRNKIKRKLGNSSIAHVEILDYIKGSYEYLTHESKDAIAKKKHIYDKKNILHINDFDLDRYITLDESQKRELKNQLLQIIRKKHLVNVLHLLDFLEKNGSEYGITNLNDVNDVVTSNASGFRLYFDANYQDGFRRERKINRETGEISDDFER
ncbi:replication protein [Enterococcus faecalis]|uniref:Rep family protein n=2 Tax=Enterococcus TaxID=1350 RepID=UPI000B9FCB66|nr:Rep family protein [Enterococcus faecium]EGO8273407.1 replication protein RepB [Enterococcus faecalis]EGO8273591.1 replication protein RepB [Enterococcus faecalis]ELT8931741.1 replication protein [Enterococcus faecalis]ELT8931847.1 replication protein [Enterococcus faecalis]OZS36169.1 replication protein RepB [Enterococcus faecium]